MKAPSDLNGVTLRRIFLRYVSLGFGLVLALNRAQAQLALEAPFTRITNSPAVADSGMWCAAAWGDYDNDGWLDLLVANFAAAGRHGLYHNNGDGTFSKVLTGPLSTDASAQAFGVAWGDYDNDGWLEVVIPSYTGSTPGALYRNTGNGSFVRMTAADIGSLATDLAKSHGVSWGDYDGDGRLDLFVANGSTDAGQQDFLYHQDDQGRFQRVTNSITALALASARGAWVDFDNDGDMDLFVTHRAPPGTLSAPNQLFRNEGAGQFTDVAAFAGLADRNSVGAIWGDIDNDGDLDLLTINMNLNGPITHNWFYRNRGDGTFERITEGPVAEDQDHFTAASFVDYDNDGWLDLFVTIVGPGTAAPNGVYSRLYHNQGDGTFTKVTSGSLVTHSQTPACASWGDYDNDGFLDVFMSFGAIYSAQRNALFHNNGNSNHWIKIKCVGTLSNRSAVGTKVRVRARINGADRWQLRQIGCNQDWVVFNSLDAVIGLGDASLIETLRVEWPSGIAQEFHEVGGNQTLTIVEQTDLSITSRSPHQFDLTLKGPRLQRYRLDTTSDLLHWSPVTSLTITNLDRTVSFSHLPLSNESRLFFRAKPD